MSCCLDAAQVTLPLSIVWDHALQQAPEIWPPCITSKHTCHVLIRHTTDMQTMFASQPACQPVQGLLYKSSIPSCRLRRGPRARARSALCAAGKHSSINRHPCQPAQLFGPCQSEACSLMLHTALHTNALLCTQACSSNGLRHMVDMGKVARMLIGTPVLVRAPVTTRGSSTASRKHDM